MNRYDTFYSICDWDDCDHAKKKRPKPCSPGCRPDMPLYPAQCCGREEDSFRVRLFGSCGQNCDDRRLPPAAPPVTIVNPWNCREKAVVLLSVDECGNLVVRVKR